MTNVAVKISIRLSRFRRLRPFPDASKGPQPSAVRAIRTLPFFSPPTVCTRAACGSACSIAHLCSQGEKEKGQTAHDCLPAPLRLSVAIFRRKGLPSACKPAQRCVFCSVGTAAFGEPGTQISALLVGFGWTYTKTQGSSSHIQA